MADGQNLGKTRSEPTLAPDDKDVLPSNANLLAPDASPPTGASTPSNLSRSGSLSGESRTGDSDDFDSYVPPLERMTAFDILENLALPQRLEKLSSGLNVPRERLKRLKSSGMSAKDRLADEIRRQRQSLLPPGGTAEEQLEKYRRRMVTGVDRLGERWNDSKAVTAREKLSFLFGVLNIFISGYLVGRFPEHYHIWYTVQLCYFMPIRYWTYHQKGYHYFLADLCYFVNLLMLLSLWFFPNSKRLFISTYCLAFGNNAVAIALWRNSLVFHSLDKVTSLFIHIMPCVTLHCIIHLLPAEHQKSRFPAIYTIKYSPPSSPEHYTLRQMMIWATVPYFVWQMAYHFLITVRRREKIRAGRPTSFTWLRKSYAPTWIGRVVLSLPDALQEPAFMGIQYSYALLTIIPCPIWFWSRWASAIFLFTVFVWSVYNGATYYIDVFGNRFQRELESLKRDVARWQQSPAGAMTPPVEPGDMNEHQSNDNKDGAAGEGEGDGSKSNGSGNAMIERDDRVTQEDSRGTRGSIDSIPMLDQKPTAVASGAENTGTQGSGASQRK